MSSNTFISPEKQRNTLTPEQKQRNTVMRIHQLLTAPDQFKGTTLSTDKYALRYLDPQTGHTLFSALMSVGKYSCAKNILKKTFKEVTHYDMSNDDRLMYFCNFDKCGPMLMYLKTANRRQMRLAGIPEKDRRELESISQMIRRRLSIDASDTWLGNNQPNWENTPVPNIKENTVGYTSADHWENSKEFNSTHQPYTAANATMQAIDDDEDERYERYQRQQQYAEEQRQKTLKETLAQHADALKPTEPVQQADTPTKLESVQPTQPDNKPTPALKVAQNDAVQTNFEELLFSNQHGEKE